MHDGKIHTGTDPQNAQDHEIHAFVHLLYVAVLLLTCGPAALEQPKFALYFSMNVGL